MLHNSHKLLFQKHGLLRLHSHDDEALSLFCPEDTDESVSKSTYLLAYEYVSRYIRNFVIFGLLMQVFYVLFAIN